jgi:type IV pilus assembly protein PilB
MVDIAKNNNRQPLFSSSLIGQRLIEAGYLTEDHLQKALHLQKETGLLLGEVCLLQGWITYGQLKECLPNLRTKLGDKLLAHGLLTMEQLWMAILEQRLTGAKLGEIVVDRGWIDQARLNEIMSPATSNPKQHK